MAEHTHQPHDLPDEGLLWSKGIARLCDSAGPRDYWAQGTELVQSEDVIERAFAGASGLIWVRLGSRSREGETVDIDTFATRVLPTISRPFVLLSTDGDSLVPQELRRDTVDRLLASPWLRAWYTQNCGVIDHPVIRPFPIGLPLHFERPFGSPRKSAEQLRALSMAAVPAAARPMTLYSDIGISPASGERRVALSLLHNAAHAVVASRRITQIATWRRYAANRFVLSLRGNGLDCHRTWEALHLGAIVVTTHSSLDPLYRGLPVVLIDRLEELVDPQNLVRWSESHLHLADREQVWQRLQARDWIDALRQHLSPAD